MKYPFYKHSEENLKLPKGEPVSSLTLDALRQAKVEPKDLGIHPDTLKAQADVAEKAGFHQLAANLRRSAELVNIPDERILSVYNALRPGRSTPQQLEAIAKELEEEYDAPMTAAFIREAK